MTLRKITIDNNVNYIHSANTPAIEISHDTKLDARKKNASDNKLHKRIKNSLKLYQQKDSVLLKEQGIVSFN